jgi:hypothetical protein
MWPTILLTGLGIARVIEWVKELSTLAPWKRWPGRFSKMLMSMALAGAATAFFSPAGVESILIFFFGVAAVATTAHEVWSTLAATRDCYRLQLQERIHAATRQRSR